MSSSDRSPRQSAGARFDRRPCVGSPAEIQQTGRIDTVRIDQWLHAVRLTKTRSEAAAACRGGHVDVNDKAAKPATTVQAGDRVEAFIHRRRRTVVVERPITKRVGAALAVECYTDHSPPPPERAADEAVAVRDPGSGRPTKRERRQLDRLRGRRR